MPDFGKTLTDFGTFIDLHGIPALVVVVLLISMMLFGGFLALKWGDIWPWFTEKGFPAWMKMRTERSRMRREDSERYLTLLQRCVEVFAELKGMIGSLQQTLNSINQVLQEHATWIHQINESVAAIRIYLRMDSNQPSDTTSRPIPQPPQQNPGAPQ